VNVRGTALVLGLGASGFAAAKLLLQEGSDVTVIDQASDDSVREKAEELESSGATVRCGVSKIPSGAFDTCIVSPGIDSASGLVQEAEALGIPAISELELGFRYCRCPVVAVTGTNGKSTTVKLCHDALSLAGARSAIAGNYGPPICDVAGETKNLDWLVLEVSSFQLERIISFRPKVGVLLNVQPDHLDRHGDMETYMALKYRMFNRMDSDDTGIVPEENWTDLSRSASGNRWVRFGSGKTADYRFGDGHVVCAADEKQGFSLGKTIFDNPVLGLNAAAAAATVSACGYSASIVGRAAIGFKPLEHRMEHVGLLNGVSFVNDSKATNLSAMVASLKAAPGRVRLVAGGLLKEKDLNLAKEVLARKAHAVYLIGNDAKRMRAAWNDTVKCTIFNALEAAVMAAWKDASQGDTILLAPGCASFDQFDSYKDRGNQFKHTVEVINGQLSA